MQTFNIDMTASVVYDRFVEKAIKMSRFTGGKNEEISS